MIRATTHQEITRAASSRRRSGLSSIALFLASLATLSASILLAVYLLSSTRIDENKVAVLALTIAVLAPTLFARTRGGLKTYIRKMIHREPPGGDIVEIDMHEMRYFVAGEDKDVLVVTGNGLCWGRGFLILSKALPQIQSTFAERGRADGHKMLDIFMESAYSNKLPLQTTMSLSPIDEDQAIHEIQDSLNLPADVIGRMDENKRISMIHGKLGVWQSRMIMSTRSTQKPPTRISDIIEEVHANLLQLKALFNAAFPDYIIEKVAGKREIKKIATFMLTHSEGSDLIHDGGGTTLLNGKELTEFISIPHLIGSQFPESFPYKEFQLSPHLESDVSFASMLDDAGNPIAQTGLRTAHLREGIAVFGDNEDQLDLTNKTIVSKLATSSTPYIVFTRETKYRPLISLIPDAIVVQLGEQFTINPLDTEGTNADQYIPLILTVFENSFPLSDEQANMLFTILHDIYAEGATPTLSKLRDHADDIATSGKETLARIRTLEGITKTLTRLMVGNAGEALSSAPATQFKNLLETSSPLIIIEFKGTTDPTEIRFIEGMLLAKLYALYATRRSPVAPYGPRMLLLEEADILLKNASLRYIRRAVQPAETMSKWVHELSRYGVGLHISTRTPSQLDESILTRIGTKITHRITSPTEATIVSKLINLEPQTPTRRSQGDTLPITANIPDGEALLTRPDTRKPIPVRIMHTDVSGLPYPDDAEVTRRISHTLLGVTTTIREPRTLLEIDYPDEETRRIATEVLELLREYVDFGKATIIKSFDKNQQQKIRELLPKLEDHRYIATTNIEVDEGKLRKVYKLTQKGEKALADESEAEDMTATTTAADRPEQPTATQPSPEGNRIISTTALRPLLQGALGGIAIAGRLFNAGKFALTLQRTNKVLTEFLISLARKQGIKITLENETSLEEIMASLGDSALPLPTDRNAVTWISERAIETRDEETQINKEEALKAIEDAVSFLKQMERLLLPE